MYRSRMENVLYYGDNLDILRRYVKDESVDLIYLDPPFKSDQNYTVLFRFTAPRKHKWVVAPAIFVPLSRP